jgi:hypothetical protein
MTTRGHLVEWEGSLGQDQTITGSRPGHTRSHLHMFTTATCRFAYLHVGRVVCGLPGIHAPRNWQACRLTDTHNFSILVKFQFLFTSSSFNLPYYNVYFSQ